jgi:hypothetical protein
MFSLPELWRGPVEDVLATYERSIEVTVAAHGLIGSSPIAFRRMATFLVLLLGLDLSSRSDDAVWDAWGQAGGAYRA